MPTLHVRSVPEDLYQEIQKLAEERSRSLSAQVVTMLAQALEEEKSRKTQTKALESIRRRRFSAPLKSPSSLELLREDRKR
ncbi:MAG TPA: hypothetical protein VFY26_23150 [Anaerolineales bacterium]|nr:hypothetical protein [Anaerolineales bacterium]